MSASVRVAITVADDQHAQRIAAVLEALEDREILISSQGCPTLHIWG